EMTPILGETVDGRKVTQRSAKVLPETTVYDIDLTLSLPARVTAASGMNAIAHAVEGLYAHDANPITSLMAAEGIAALAHALPQLVDAPDDAGARRDALYGAWLCGCCLGSMAMGLHHKLCHTLGGMFGLPHAETHAVVLPYATAYNIGAAPRAMRSIASALDASRADAGLHDLARRLPLPRTLRELGMPEHGIDAAADEAVKSPYPNPRPLEHAAIRDLIAAAWSGSPLQTF
ncbi:MAG TPA: maleylacetate reductase, partial [Casimicrobiaceae bacterium]|nr:maleylacetate reductase [Casimicrobiaceae bacterium]